MTAGQRQRKEVSRDLFVALWGRRDSRRFFERSGRRIAGTPFAESSVMSDAIIIAAPADLLGSAMHFVLTVAAGRARHWPPAKPRGDRTEETPDLAELTALWELAERYHPEQVWLAESWLRGERTLSELERTAPRGTLSPGFLEAAGPLVQAGSVSSARPARRPGHVPEPTPVRWSGGLGA